jgi:Permuted papain-like amidase enzyme, YaeF/YiiX, C92 family
MKRLLTLSLFSFFLYFAIVNATGHTGSIVARSNFIDPYAMIREGQSLLKEGDLVVRLNRDPASRFIRRFNRHDKSFSHSGIVLFENGYPYIYHIVNGEENPDEKLRKDSLNRFCNPRKNASYGIFRYNWRSGEMEKLKDVIHEWYTKGVRFDHEFNLESDDKMYCSEMISKALAKSTANRILIEKSKLTATEASIFSMYTHLPFAYAYTLQVVSIDDLYINPFCRVIKKYDFDIGK